MTLLIDQHQAQLLDRLQEAVPLAEQPFAEIGRRIDMTEDEVITAVEQLKAKPRPVIRQISAIFDSRALGYQSCLVAAKVPEALIDAAAAVIGEHPGVSHNYKRNHAFNLWFTLAVPPDTTLGLERTVEVLRQRSGATSMLLLPALKLYKIGVKFSMSGDGEVPAATNHGAAHPPTPQIVITPRDKSLIRVLQQDLPIVPRPFDAWAEQADMSVAELLAAAEKYVETGVMRRFSAVLRHREAGFGANAMGAWVVPPAEHDSFGAAAAAFHAVSHCYLRPTHPHWPYSIFTMVHGRSREECEATLSEISRMTGMSEYAALYSTHEYKKVRIKYFEGDIEKWERTVHG